MKCEPSPTSRPSVSDQFWLKFLALQCVPSALILAAIGSYLWPNLVPDDGRHFTVWLRTYLSPELFPNDQIAEHFRSITPVVYKAYMWVLGLVGIDPVIAQFPLMIAGTLATLLMLFVFINRHWNHPEAVVVGILASSLLSVPYSEGLPRSFFALILVLILTAYLARRPIWVAVALAAGVGLYPAAAAVGGLSIAILCLSSKPPFLVRDGRKLASVGLGFIAAVAGAYLFLSVAESTGPTMTLAEGRELPIFRPGGRAGFFHPDPLTFYLCQPRAGVSVCDLSLIPLPELLGYLLAIFLLVSPFALLNSTIAGRVNSWLVSNGFPPVSRDLAKCASAIVVSGLLLAIASHLFAFKLHVPAKFSQRAVFTAFSLSLAPLLGALLVQQFSAIDARFGKKWATGLAIVGLITAQVHIVYGSVRSMRITAAPNVHHYLRSTPIDTLVAGLAREVDFVPAVASRSAFASLELAVPYKRNNYLLHATRFKALSQALINDSPDAFQKLVQREGINYIIMHRDKGAQLRDVERLSLSFPGISMTVDHLKAGRPVFYRSRLKTCTVAEDTKHLLLGANCLTE